MAEILHKAGQPEIGQGRPLGEASFAGEPKGLSCKSSAIPAFQRGALKGFKALAIKIKTIQISKAKNWQKPKKPFLDILNNRYRALYIYLTS